MKKLLAILLVICLCGCQGDYSNSDRRYASTDAIEVFTKACEPYGGLAYHI